MSKYQIGAVTFKQTVSTQEKFIISVTVIDWDWVKKNLTWNSLKTRYKWGDLLG